MEITPWSYRVDLSQGDDILPERVHVETPESGGCLVAWPHAGGIQVGLRTLTAPLISMQVEVPGSVDVGLSNLRYLDPIVGGSVLISDVQDAFDFVVIDWGDDSDTGKLWRPFPVNVSHIYATSGEYRITAIVVPAYGYDFSAHGAILGGTLTSEAIAVVTI